MLCCTPNMFYITQKERSFIVICTVLARIPSELTSTVRWTTAKVSVLIKTLNRRVVDLNKCSTHASIVFGGGDEAHAIVKHNLTQPYMYKFVATNLLWVENEQINKPAIKPTLDHSEVTNSGVRLSAYFKMGETRSRTS